MALELITQGNLFESRAQTWVNAVNCAGIMGKGIALEFKNRFPEMFQDYAARCRHGDVRLNRPYLFKSLKHPWILNFPTKTHWRDSSPLDAIAGGLDYLGRNYETWGIKSLVIPALGCGLGGLDWTAVGPILKRYLEPLKIPVELYLPLNRGYRKNSSIDLDRD
jgi:O-acetyl-ADP-ribose deacetylase (regulator of RNase III)